MSREQYERSFWAIYGQRGCYEAVAWLSRCWEDMDYAARKAANSWICALVEHPAVHQTWMRYHGFWSL